jgi:hypothetical protein
MYLISALLGAGSVALLKENWMHAAVLLTLAAIVVFIPVNRSLILHKKNTLE